MLLHLLFLLKSQDVLQGKSREGLKAFDSLLTILWKDQLRQLGHFKNSIELSQCCKRNFQSSASMATEWTWKGCKEGSKIFLAIWIESVMIMILEMPSQFEAWLILYLMAKSSTLVLVMWTAWWTVLAIGLLYVCICNIDIAVLFLILASMTTIAVEGEFDNSMIMLSSCWVRVLLPSCLLCRLNTNQSEKLSITLWPGEGSEWKRVKKGKISLNLLSVSTKWLLMREHWHLVRESSKAGCWDGHEVDTLL